MDARDLILYSQVIIMLTHASQWKAVKIPNDTVQSVMNTLTRQWMQELVKAGLYPALRDVLMRGMARSKPALTSATLFPLLTLIVRPMVSAGICDDSLFSLKQNTVFTALELCSFNLCVFSCLRFSDRCNVIFIQQPLLLIHHCYFFEHYILVQKRTISVQNFSWLLVFYIEI